MFPLALSEQEKQYPEGSSHALRLKALTQLVQQQERPNMQDREDESSAFISESMGDLSQVAGRPNITATEIMAGVKPQAMPRSPNRFADTIRRDQMGGQRDILDKYKTTNERSKILGDYEKLTREQKDDIKNSREKAEEKRLRAEEKKAADKAKKEALDEKRNLDAQVREEKRKDRWRTVDESTYQTAMSKTRGMQRGSATNIGRIINRNRLARDALRIVKLIESKGPDHLVGDRTIAAELATSMASLISAGSPTVSGIEHLTPKDLRGDVQALADYITSKPKEFLSDARIKQFRHQLEAQKDFYEGELTDEEARITRSLMPVFKRQIGGEYVNADLEDSYLNAIEASRQHRRAGEVHPATKPDTSGQAIAGQEQPGAKAPYVTQNGVTFKLDITTGKYEPLED